ncbi:outer membrane protein OmpK [Cupriavidus necator]
MKLGFLGKLAAAAVTTTTAMTAMAADWSTTSFEYRRGNTFNDNGSTGGPKFSKDLFEVENVTGSSWGRTYFFLLMEKTPKEAERSAGMYSEGDVYLSLSKLSGTPFSFGPVKDMNVQVGYNYGAKNSSFGPNAAVVTYGVGFELDVPKFTYFNFDVVAYRDQGTYSGFGGGDLCGRHATTYQLTPSWKAPFTVGNLKFVFDGYMDIIGAHGTCKQQILTEAQIKLDVGDFWGKPGNVYMGVEYQYWKNKFGSKASTERVPQLVLHWVL